MFTVNKVINLYFKVSYGVHVKIYPMNLIKKEVGEGFIYTQKRVHACFKSR